MNIGQKLDIINISKYYADFKVLHGINMTCLPGEFVTILGSSGSGKTTLLKLLKEEIRPDGKMEGEIENRYGSMQT